jgi:hypothetical protein
LPQAAKANINIGPPFDRKAGEAPAPNPAEIDNIVALLAPLLTATIQQNKEVKQELKNGSLIQLFAALKSSGSYYLGFPKRASTIHAADRVL